MEDVKSKPKPTLTNNNYLKEKHDTDEYDDNGGVVACVEDEALMMMNNKFFNDDIYNYKDTFLSGRSINNSNSGHYAHSKSNNTSNSTKNFAYEDEDYDLNDEEAETEDVDEEDDENNDFSTGPLAKKSPGAGQHRTHFDEMDENMESLKFQEGEEYDDFDESRQPQSGISYFDEEEETGNEMFFKRVDSLDMVKPKKAKIIKNYLFGEMLGDGSYGKVKECLDMGSLARRAVKIINLKMVARKIPRGVENVRKEISIMRSLQHKNVIRLYDTFEKGPNSAIGANKAAGLGNVKMTIFKCWPMQIQCITFIKFMHSHPKKSGVGFWVWVSHPKPQKWWIFNFLDYLMFFLFKYFILR